MAHFLLLVGRGALGDWAMDRGVQIGQGIVLHRATKETGDGTSWYSIGMTDGQQPPGMPRQNSNCIRGRSYSTASAG